LTALRLRTHAKRTGENRTVLIPAIRSCGYLVALERGGAEKVLRPAPTTYGSALEDQMAGGEYLWEHLAEAPKSA